MHLADKELAVLLHEVSESGPDGQAKRSPHILVSLDCCHSGSGTREYEIHPELKSRKAELQLPASRSLAARKEEIRSLKSYAGGFYAKQWEEQQVLEIPMSSHVLLSACESVQLAGDLPQGGVFTSGLIAGLESAKGKLNYSELYQRTRAAVQKIRRQDQTPQFDTIGDFNPFTRFLEGSELGSTQRYEVIEGRRKWYVKCGAIHGLPLQSERPVEVEIQTLAPENKPLGKAFLKGIGAQKSQLAQLEGFSLEKGTSYQAILKFLPAPPMLVWVHGEEGGLAALDKVWDASKNIQMVKSLEEYGEAQLEVEINEQAYQIIDRRTARRVKSWPRKSDYPVEGVCDILGKMVNWERTLRLNNEKSEIKDWVEFELPMITKNPREPDRVISDAETVIAANSSNLLEKGGALFAGFAPRIRVKNVDQNLYAYLFHFRSNYAIESYEGEVIYRPEEHADKTDVVIPMWKKPKAWGLSPEDDSAVSHFKILLTTEQLDYHQLLQSGIDSQRELEMEFNPLSVEDDWCSLTLKVVMERAHSV